MTNINTPELNVVLPGGQGYSDLQPATRTEVISTNNAEGDVFSLLNLVNQYLWYSLGIIAMALLVITGIKLIIARGDDKEMKKATKIFLGVVVGVFIALLSYLLVRVVINAF